MRIMFPKMLATYRESAKYVIKETKHKTNRGTKYLRMKGEL